MEEAIEKSSACVCGIKDCDGGNGDWECRVDGDLEEGQDLAALLVNGKDVVAHKIRQPLLSLDLLRLLSPAKLFCELVVRLGIRVLAESVEDLGSR